MSGLGHFIVVEGLEGAGKSTAVDSIKHFLANHVDGYIATREPGGTRVGDAVRQLIKQVSEDELLDPRAELLLLYASRIQLVERVIKPALNKGLWVLADRFELSTFAYQGGGRGLDLQMIEQLSSFSLDGFAPNLIIFLDVSPELGLSRVLKRGAADRIERESLVFFTAVYNAYREKIKSMRNVVVIDGSQSMEQVQRAVVDALTQYMHEQV